MRVRTLGLEAGTVAVLVDLASLRARRATIHLAWARLAVEWWINGGAPACAAGARR